MDGTRNTPSHCICGKPFTIDHALSCTFGGYPKLGIRNNILSEVCHNVSMEPTVQSGTGDTFKLNSASTDIGARSDITADGHFEKENL